MANINVLKRRIRTARNVSKTTKALEMISASKLKRAQDEALASRPYVDQLGQVMNKLSQGLKDKETHPYFRQPSSEKTLLIYFSPDKGLCGGLITNLNRELVSFDKENKETIYIAVGKKAEAGLVRFNKNLTASFSFGTNLPPFENVFPLLNLIEDFYLNGKVSKVKILTPKFVNVFSQVVAIEDLLPIKNLEQENENREFLVEPSQNELLPYVAKHYIEMAIYQYFLECYLAEQSARMVAMQNATNNAKDLIEDFTLEYNKRRQEKITNEILDISGGGAFASL
jgi:F-type H+-transporting ATPase subunit gamma